MASKQQERIYLDWFLQRENFVYESLTESEHPDFILNLSDKTVGIEICNIYVGFSSQSKGSEVKRQESHRNKWLKSLTDEYYSQTNVPLWVCMLAPLSYSSYRDAKDDILTFLLQSSRGEIDLSQNHILKTTAGYFQISITRFPNTEEFQRYSGWRCVNDHMGWVAQLTNNDSRITSIVLKKEEKAKSYRSRCDDIWLLIVADSKWASGFARYFGNEHLSLETNFNAIWLLEYPNKSIQLL